MGHDEDIEKQKGWFRHDHVILMWYGNTYSINSNFIDNLLCGAYISISIILTFVFDEIKLKITVFNILSVFPFIHILQWELV